MRVLLLHPEDVPLQGESAGSHWDLIVDLGFAGASVYEEWSRQTGSRVISLHQFSDQESFRWVKRGLVAGQGRLLDRIGARLVGGIWLLASIKTNRHFICLSNCDGKLARVQSSWSRPERTRMFRLLSVVAEWPVRVLAPALRRSRLISRLLTAAQDLRPSQIVEIAFDKWDPSYRFRSKITKHRRVQLKEPVLLLSDGIFQRYVHGAGLRFAIAGSTLLAGYDATQR